MPQPLQPLPHLQASPLPHFPEQHDIFELGWGWMAGDGGSCWLLAGLLDGWLEEQWQGREAYL
jgi:hypothetical protein